MNDSLGFMSEFIPDTAPKLKRHQRKPMGIIKVLMGLCIGGFISYGSVTSRPDWVMKDFQKLQGVYAGSYFRNGTPYVTVITPDQRVITIMVAQGVTFKSAPGIGSHVEVLYVTTDPAHPQIVRREDLRVLGLSDPEAPSRSTGYW